MTVYPLTIIASLVLYHYFCNIFVCTEEFVAHGSNVNCLALGPSSGRVMVTGGEDRKVNMWAIGKPNVIMSLAGHTSPVECVQFNGGEDLVLAGSQSGTLKIWDLEAAKILRTLTGHKSSIRSLDFHPYGDFVASGSLDTNLKLWDVRRKGCIFTYKGHTDCVNSLKFSPDGRWIISSGEDGSAKLWDLTAGKLINDFKHHTGPVNCAEFHPKEFLLATGSSDRTVKFWDLETFQIVSTTDIATCPIRCIKFHSEGMTLFSGAQDSLKIYGWEPVKCYESFPLGWGRVADLSLSSNQMIGAGYSQTNVSVWVIDLGHLENLIAKANEEKTDIGNYAGEVPQESAPVIEQLPQKIISTKTPPRRAFNTDRPQTTSTKSKSSRPSPPVVKEEPQEDDDKNIDKPVEDDRIEEIFHARNKLDRSPKLKKKLEPFQAPVDDNPAPNNSRAPINPEPPKPEPVALAQTKNIVPSERDKPAGLHMSDFLPPKPVVQPEPISKPYKDNHFSPPAPQISEAQSVDMLTKSHVSICSIMAARQQNLSIIAKYWGEGEIKVAIKTAVNMNDPAILVDILNVLCLKQTLWNLDICLILLPQLKDLFISKYESYAQAAASALKLILRNFAPVIKSNMSAPPVSIGVDLVREERYNKCQACHAHLQSIRSVISSKTALSGKMGSLFRELSLAFSAVD
ncbi:hypothetical protein QZH41_018074 [Actinostola sp. cb2023]|nr:hypothetical protein QZH41_018074 [Actinostola sp. cb2023]